LTQREQQRARVLTEVVAGRWTVAEAAQVLGLSVRQVWRLKATYVQEGATALAHGNRGRPASGRIADGIRQRVVELVRGPYADCNDSHLVELLLEREGIELSRMTLCRILGAAGLRAGRRQRAPRHRRRRDRMSQAGMLLQIDGSPHHWLGPDQPRCTLIGAVDDATGEPVAAVFRQQEDAHGYFLLLQQQVLRVHGVPQALYHDRHSIFQRDTRASMTLDEELAGRLEPTQFGRALEELGIGSIAARSPQAKGRIERLWGTLQGRLVQELRLAGITDLEAANAFLPGFLARYTARFAVAADDPGQAYRPVAAEVDWDQVLSFRYPRVVNNDNTVQWMGHTLQIPPGPRRRSYARAHVYVHELLDGSLGVWYEGGWLLRTPAPAQPQPLRARKRSPVRSTRPSVPPPATPPSPARPAPKQPRTPWRPPATHPWRGFKIPLPTPRD